AGYTRLRATVREISFPSRPFAVAAYYRVATAEASTNLAAVDGVHCGYRAKSFANLIEMVCRGRGEAFGQEVKRRIMLGTYVLSSGYKDAYYLKALKVRRLIKDGFYRAFTGCDVIMGPTSPTPAFRVGDGTAGPVSVYLLGI